VHVDGTARPQVVRKATNPSFHRVLEEYRKLTGVGTVVNTSFNMHEEPIVCTPQDAVRSFMRGHLDYLAIGPFLVENPQLGPVVGHPPRRAAGGSPQ
jgi:carbamoyltransferase